MDSVYVIGDAITVNVFRSCGIEGVMADPRTSEEVLRDLLGKEDAAVILVTRECAQNLSGMIRKLNLESADRIIVEIPGIDDERGFGGSLTGYITEALGVAL